MGRSNREKPLTNAEREKRWHEKTLVLIERSYNKEEKTKKRLKLSESEIIEQRATERESKRKSRKN